MHEWIKEQDRDKRTPNGFHVFKPLPSQNMLTSSEIVPFGTRLNLLTGTHIGTPVRIKKPFTLDFILTISIGIAELKFQIEGWLPTIKQHNSRSVPRRIREGTASSQNNKDQNLQSLTTTARIEIHQSPTAAVMLIMRHSQPTSSPDER